jgi:hypothetical protein
MRTFALTAAIAAAAMLAGTTLALAADDAIVLKDSPVYKTKSGSQVINEVEEDDEVTVLECGTQRCKIQIPGPDGWIRKNRLAPIDDEGEPQKKVPFQFGLTFGPSGPGISIGVGGGGGSGISVDAGTGPSSGPRACIYQAPNYGGAFRCFAEGTTTNLTSVGWNDVASSIRFYGGAGAQVCQDVGGGGTCYNINTNTNNLGGFNAQMSYIDVY